MTKRFASIWKELTKFAISRQEKLGVPGFSLGIICGEEIQTAGFGVTSVAHPLSVTDETLFQIGSITKTFTGVLIMQLVESGDLDLDSLIRTVLPNFRVKDEEASEQATLRHLLTHTCGWAGDTCMDTGNGSDALALHVEKMASLEQLAPIGTVWSYNNAGFGVAGRMIEVVTGKSYGEVLRERLVKPLGFRTGFLNPGDVMTERFAVGHHVGSEGASVAKPWALAKYVEPMGSLVCDIKDLLIYARFHLGDGQASSGGGRIITAESLAAMHEPIVNIWGNESWSLPFSILDRDGIRVVAHGGGTTGQASLFTTVPEKAFAVATITNADRGGRLAREIAAWALDAYVDIPSETPQPIRVEESVLSELVGRYGRPFADVEIRLQDGQLVAQTTYKMGSPTADYPPPPAPPPVKLIPCADDRLVMLDGPNPGTTIDVVRTEERAIGWLRIGSRIHQRLSHVD